MAAAPGRRLVMTPAVPVTAVYRRHPRPPALSPSAVDSGASAPAERRCGPGYGYGKKG